MFVFIGDKGVVLNSRVEYDSIFAGPPGKDAVLCIISTVSIKILDVTFACSEKNRCISYNTIHTRLLQKQKLSIFSWFAFRCCY